MDIMIKIAENLKKNIENLLPKSISIGIVKHIHKEIDNQLIAEKIKPRFICANCGKDLKEE